MIYYKNDKIVQKYRTRFAVPGEKTGIIRKFCPQTLDIADCKILLLNKMKKGLVIKIVMELSGNRQSAKPTKRKLQAVETKKKIYQTALEIINQKGFRDTSIEDITKAAGVAKGTFYLYFKSKNDLVRYTFARNDEVYRMAYERVKHLDFVSAATNFAKIAYTQHQHQGKNMISAIYMQDTSETYGQIFSSDRGLQKCLSEIVRIGKTQGVLDRDKPDDAYVSAFLSALIGTEIIWVFDERSRSLPDLIEEHVRICATGMIVGRP